MKYLKILPLLLLPLFAAAQPLGTWPVQYGDTPPTHTPSGSGTRIYLNISTNDLYNWNPAPVSSWIKYPKGFDQISGCAAPGYTPNARQSVFAVNSCTVLQNGMGPELYYYTGSAWLQINKGQTYEAGSGIDITDGVISSTATSGPDSTFAKIDDLYQNKRISSNVYRYGTSGFGTKDTLGTVNIANSSATKPAISSINTPILLYHKRGSMPPWRLQQKSTANTDGSTNNVLELMYNWYGSGTDDAPGDAQFGISLEPHWITANGDTVAEAHIPMFYDVNRNPFRAMTFFLDYHSKKNRSSIGYGIDQIHFDGDLLNLQTKITVNKYASGGDRPLEVYKDRKTISTTATSYTSAQMDTVTTMVVSNHRKGVTDPLQGVSTILKFEANQGRKGAFYMGVVDQVGTNFDAGADFIGYYNASGVFKEAFRVLDANGYFGILHGGTSRPVRPLDVNGTAIFRGSTRVNMTGDSAALILKFASAQTTPIMKLQANNGTDLAFFNAYNPSLNPSLVVGTVSSVNSASPNNTVFGLTNTAFTSGNGNNALFGFNTGGTSFNGYENTHAGSGAGRNSTSAFQNTNVGYLAGGSITTAYQCMFLGRLAGFSCQNGNTTVAVGSTALQSCVTPTGTVVVGSQAAQNSTTSNNAVVIGNLAARQRSDISGSVILGAYTANSTGTATNQLWIDNSNTSTPLIGGDFTNNSVGINTAPGSISPSAALEITSTTQGVLFPRMTASQRGAISSPATGLTIYCTDCTATDSSTGVMQTYNGSAWKNNW